MDILEKSFVIFRLPAFSTNQRNEISKSRKIYFYDLGLRNAVIGEFGNMELRNDKGAIWENFVISELLKQAENKRDLATFYFWRTYTQQEIDLIIKKNNTLQAVEIKISAKKQPKIPESFIKNYPDTTFSFINQENWLEFLA